MHLTQVGEKTYYIKNNTNIGVYRTGESSVCLIDTGSKGDGEKIEKALQEQGWSIDYIINTHTHIDHVGGNGYLMKKYHIPAYCTDLDMAFAHYSDLEAAYMNGGYPCRKLREIFSHPGMIGFASLERSVIDGISWIYLPGHTFGMAGIKTDDDVWFLADSYLSRKYLEKHRFGYLYDVAEYLDNLEYIKTLDGRLFIPAHGTAEEEITEIADLNIANVKHIISVVKGICAEYASLDAVIKNMYQAMGLREGVANHVLLSSTTKSYLTYLQDRDELECRIIDGVMMWKTV